MIDHDELIRREREAADALNMKLIELCECNLDMQGPCIYCWCRQRIAVAAAALEAASLNERRYLWLRDQQYSENFDLRFMDHNEDGPTDVWYSCWNDELDAAIDAALASETRSGEDGSKCDPPGG